LSHQRLSPTWFIEAEPIDHPAGRRLLAGLDSDKRYLFSDTHDSTPSTHHATAAPNVGRRRGFSDYGSRSEPSLRREFVSERSLLILESATFASVDHIVQERFNRLCSWNLDGNQVRNVRQLRWAAYRAKIIANALNLTGIKNVQAERAVATGFEDLPKDKLAMLVPSRSNAITTAHSTDVKRDVVHDESTIIAMRRPKTLETNGRVPPLLPRDLKAGPSRRPSSHAWTTDYLY
jgi:hypothetical protein